LDTLTIYNRSPCLPPRPLASHTTLPPPHPHPFPTRRSSDLAGRPARDRGRASPKHADAKNECDVWSKPAHLLLERPGRQRVFISDRKSTRLNSSHLGISYAVFCLKKKKKQMN